MLDDPQCGLIIIKHDHQPLLVHDCTTVIEDASIMKCDPECGSTIIKHDHPAAVIMDGQMMTTECGSTIMKHDHHRCCDHGRSNDDNCRLTTIIHDHQPTLDP